MSNSIAVGKWLLCVLVTIASSSAYGQLGLSATPPNWNNAQPNWNNGQQSWNNSQPNRNNAQPNWNTAQPNNSQPVWNNAQPSNSQQVWNNVPPNNSRPVRNNGQPVMANTQPVWNNTSPGFTNAQPVRPNVQYQQPAGQPGWNTTPTPLESLPTETAWNSNPQLAPIQNYPLVANKPNDGYFMANRFVENTPPVYSGCAPQAGCQSGCDSCASNNCESYNCMPCRPACQWYFSAAGLMMGRDRSRRVWTTYETNNNANQLMNTRELDSNWRGGMEFHLGRKICCGTWAVDLGYWSTEDFEASASETHASGVSSPLLFNDLEFATGVPVADYFDSAMEHRLMRRNSFHNLEVNLIETGSCCQSCQTNCRPWSCQKILGLRYFRFDEDLTFASLDQGGTWGGNGGLDEATLSDSIENHLLGAQLGCQWQRRLGCRGSFFVTPKFGVFNNRINNRFDLRRGDGTAAMPTSFSNVSGNYPVESSTDVFSFLTELNVGLSWRPTCHWSVFGGYRVMVLSGIGTADSQIPQYIVDIPEIAAIDYNDTLILQGVFAGAGYSF